MNWLLLDAGNTAVKWRVLGDGSAVLGDGQVLREPLATLPNRLAAQWPALTAAVCLGTCVADHGTRAALAGAARDGGAARVHWLGAQPRFVAPAPPGGTARVLANGYADPLQLGADRWHALIGAFVRHPYRSLVVATSGTALTVDCVQAQADGHGRFVGGVIAPGALLMRTALAHGTAQLPLAPDAGGAPPDRTDAAIAGGIAAALAGAVERTLRRFAATLTHADTGPPLLLVGGGGAAALAATLRETPDPAVAPLVASLLSETDLVLAGIASRRAEPGARWVDGAAA